MPIYAVSGDTFWGDNVLAIYDLTAKNVMVLANTINLYDQRRLRYEIKDAFSELNQVVFLRQLITSNHQVSFPADGLIQALTNPSNWVIGWDCQDQFLALEHLDRLGSPYPINQAKKNGVPVIPHQKWLDLKTVNEKAARVVNRKRIHPTLLQQCAYAGLTITEPVKPNFEPDGKFEILTNESIVELIKYHTWRAVVIGRLFNRPEYKESIRQKYELIKQYQLTTDVTDTSANVSTAVVAGDPAQVLNDYTQVDLTIERDGSPVDLLTELYSNKTIPQSVFEFYQQVAGKDLRTQKQFNQLKQGMVGSLTTLTIPYFDANNQATKNTASLSLGGAHGVMSANALPVTFDEPLAQLAEDDPAVDKQLGDYHNVYAIDADSFYPTLAIKLNIFGERYKEAKERRVKIKHSLPKNKKDWTATDRQQKQIADSDKLLINALTGKANTHNPRATLALDNKITSMRVIGNLIIYELGTAITRQLGGSVVMTNTDGIKVAFDQDSPSEDRLLSLVKTYGDLYGINYTVSHRDRVLIKDSNNLLEWEKGMLVNVTGKLSKGVNGTLPIAGSMDHPPIVDMATVAYLGRPDGSPQEFVTNYIDQHLDEQQYRPEAWSLVVRPSETASIKIGGQEITNVARVMLGQNGQLIQQLTKQGKSRKLAGWTSDQVITVPNLNQAPKPSELDRTAYIKWAINVLTKWLPSGQQLSFDEEISERKIASAYSDKGSVIGSLKNAPAVDDDVRLTNPNHEAKQGSIFSKMMAIQHNQEVHNERQ